VNELKKSAADAEVDEIHIFNAAGTIVAGTHPEYFGYFFDSGEQMAFFQPLLTDYALEFVQGVTPPTGKLVQYSALWSEDRSFIVQIGMYPSVLLRATEQNELSCSFSLLRAGAGYTLYAIGSDAEKAVGSTAVAAVGEDASEIGLRADQLEAEHVFRARVDGKPSCCLSQKIEAQNKELERQHEQLEVAVRRAETASRAKSEFLFNMSHDIRTPMNAILGFTGLALESGDAESQGEYLKNIDISSRRLLDLINNILKLSGIENHKVVIEEALTDMDGTCRKLGTILDSDLKKKHLAYTLSLELDPYMYLDATHYSQIFLEPVPIGEGCRMGEGFSRQSRRFDAGILCVFQGEATQSGGKRPAQAVCSAYWYRFLNAVSYAIKYTPGGGITALFRELPGETPDTCLWETAITDNGIGMSSEFLAHAYESFSRERNSTVSGIQGTGLGLAIVKRLVDLMRGTIQIDSQQGRGTTVTIRLPPPAWETGGKTGGPGGAGRFPVRGKARPAGGGY